MTGVLSFAEECMLALRNALFPLTPLPISKGRQPGFEP